MAVSRITLPEVQRSSVRYIAIGSKKTCASHSARYHRGCTGRRPRGFTLIEVLVVVAIIALLIAVLIPSLSRARESARCAVCLSNLSQMGKAVNMYTVDHKGTLPGPLHAGIVYHNNAAWADARRIVGATDQRILDRSIFGILVAKYFGDRSKTAAGIDEVTTCPTGDKVSPVKRGGEKPPFSSIGAAINAAGSGYYIANTSHDRVTPWPVNSPTPRLYPYGATAPRNYFGHVAQVTNSWTEIRNAGDDARPKKIESVKRASDEWAVADLWYAMGNSPTTGAMQLGTWITTAITNSIKDASGQITIAEYPFHQTTKSFAGSANQTTQYNAPRITNGKTNTLYFDGHSATVARWLGTVNPAP